MKVYRFTIIVDDSSTTKYYWSKIEQVDLSEPKYDEITKQISETKLVCHVHDEIDGRLYDSFIHQDLNVLQSFLDGMGVFWQMLKDSRYTPRINSEFSNLLNNKFYNEFIKELNGDS